MINGYRPPLMVFFDEKGAVSHISDGGPFLLDRQTIVNIISYAEAYLLENTTEGIEAYNLSILDNYSESKAHRRGAKPIKKSKDCFVYLLKDSVRGFYKIGRCKNVADRFKQLKTANPNIEIVKSYVARMDDEGELHAHFKGKGSHVDGEWFSLDENDLQAIESYFKNKTNQNAA